MVTTPAVLTLLSAAGENPAKPLARHQNGEWGVMLAADAKENDFSVRHGFRILSNYAVGRAGDGVWILIRWNVNLAGSVFESAVRCPTGMA